MEFCLKQSTSEAEMLLRENLGSLDRNHEFIDKFLNYKDFLAPDVVEMAFGMLLRENLGFLDRNHGFIDKFLNYKDFLAPDVVEMAFGATQSSPKVGGDTLPSKDTRALRDVDAEGGGKKKGKKRKKVSPAVLGFNVVSNRIMMGEIQTVED